MSVGINCKIQLNTGDVLAISNPVSNKRSLEIEGFLGAGSFKRVFMALDSTSEKLVAVSCTKGNVDEANCAIKKPHRLIGKIDLFCLPSLFTTALLTRKEGGKVLPPLFFQTSTLFHTDLKKLSEALNQADTVSLQHGFVDFNDQRIDRDALINTLITNANKVNSCFFGSNGICKHLAKAKITHGDFTSKNVFINVDENFMLVIKDLCLADWDGTQFDGVTLDDVFNAFMVFQALPMSKATNAFIEATQIGENEEKELSIKGAFVKGSGAILAAKQVLNA
jgi:hypothetical protein